MQKDATKTLPHICNERYKIRTGPNEHRCTKWNNRIKTDDKTKNILKKLPNGLPQHCIDRLIKRYL